MAPEELKGEYEELRACFLQLAETTPQASTAREVTNAVVEALNVLKDRCAALEKELRKRTQLLQGSKDDTVAARAKAAEAEQKVNKLQVLDTKLTAQMRIAEKCRRALAASQQDAASTGEVYQATIRDLNEELARARAQLAGVEKELSDGRQVMLALIGDEATGVTPAPSTIGGHSS
jgi:chromosome segregation ATPase